jgi:hypothetical protein
MPLTMPQLGGKSGGPGIALDADSLSKKRKFPKSKLTSEIRRSASTPQIRGFAQSESALSAADKRRNKLGYQRTSIACGAYLRNWSP